MAHLAIRKIRAADRDYLSHTVSRHFGSTRVISRGKQHDCLELPGYVVALEGEQPEMTGNLPPYEPVGLVLYHIQGRELEVVVLASDRAGQGVGRALLAEVIRFCEQQALRRCWLITTNNNKAAIAFYQKLGWEMVALHRGAVNESRRTIPGIPLYDSAGVPIEDELEFQVLMF
ncbi:MAG: ribosomal protein S18 acetylase RimI-like enzyme [Candidatus Azotimanducaceae bacterium]|jgi:ribosomal protein S18 acetylase RimI-like enzyme